MSLFPQVVELLWPFGRPVFGWQVTRKRLRVTERVDVAETERQWKRKWRRCGEQTYLETTQKHVWKFMKVPSVFYHFHFLASCHQSSWASFSIRAISVACMAERPQSSQKLSQSRCSLLYQPEPPIRVNMGELIYIMIMWYVINSPTWI